MVTRDNQPLDERSLTAWFIERMASFKKPKKYLFLDELPKNSYGKVLKTTLRQRLQEAADTVVAP
ncbi:putative acyl--CoA ligase YhfT [compost metagenome]